MTTRAVQILFLNCRGESFFDYITNMHIGIPHLCGPVTEIQPHKQSTQDEKVVSYDVTHEMQMSVEHFLISPRSKTTSISAR